MKPGLESSSFDVHLRKNAADGGNAMNDFYSALSRPVLKDSPDGWPRLVTFTLRFFYGFCPIVEAETYPIFWSR